MQAINITNRNGNKLQLTGDLLTGDTFSMKDYIKKYMDGKWVADQKAWRVDVAKVNRLIKQSVLRIDTDIATTQAQPKLMSYADFLRNANNPNSDY